MPTPSAWTRSASCWFCCSFSRVAEATLRILPRNGSTAWVARSRACFAEPPAEIALDDKYFRALRRRIRAICELAGQPQFAHRGLARDVLFGLAAQALLGALEREIEQTCAAWLGAVGEPMVEGVATTLSTIRAASTVCSRPLFWPWNSGSRMNTEISAAQPVITSSAVSTAARFAWPMRSA